MDSSQNPFVLMQVDSSNAQDSSACAGEPTQFVHSACAGQPTHMPIQGVPIRYGPERTLKNDGTMFPVGVESTRVVSMMPAPSAQQLVSGRTFSPMKAHLTAEVSFLRQEWAQPNVNAQHEFALQREFFEKQAEAMLTHQESRFAETASQFEDKARAVAAQELAFNNARMQSDLDQTRARLQSEIANVEQRERAHAQNVLQSSHDENTAQQHQIQILSGQVQNDRNALEVQSSNYYTMAQELLDTRAAFSQSQENWQAAVQKGLHEQNELREHVKAQQKSNEVLRAAHQQEKLRSDQHVLSLETQLKELQKIVFAQQSYASSGQTSSNAPGDRSTVHNLDNMFSQPSVAAMPSGDAYVTPPPKVAAIEGNVPGVTQANWPEVQPVPHNSNAVGEPPKVSFDLFGNLQKEADHLNATSSSSAIPVPPAPLPNADKDAENRRQERHKRHQEKPDSDSDSKTFSNKSSKEAETIGITHVPSVPQLRKFKLTFKKKVASASTDPDAAFIWISEVETATDPSQLSDSGKFRRLDAKIGSEWSPLLTGELGRQIALIEEKAAMEQKMLKGRQITWYIFQHLAVNAVEGATVTFQDLLTVELKGDNVRNFIHEWDSILLIINNPPSEVILEQLFYKQLRKSEQLKPTLALYDQDITLQRAVRDYRRLYSIVSAHLNQKTRDKNAARRVTAAAKAATSRSAAAGAKWEKGDCSQYFQKGSCSKGSSCPFRHNKTQASRSSRDKSSKGSRSGKPQQSRGRSPGRSSQGRSRSTSRSSSGSRSSGSKRISSRKPSKSKGPRGTSPSGKQDRPACTQWIKGKCSKGKQCDYFHTEICKFW